MTPTINHTPGIVVIADANTTIAYCRYNDDAEIEYIFVNSAHRRRGYAGTLLAIVQSTVQRPLRFQPPVSPLGAALQRAYVERSTAVAVTMAHTRHRKLNNV